MVIPSIGRISAKTYPRLLVKVAYEQRQCSGVRESAREMSGYRTEDCTVMKTMITRLGWWRRPESMKWRAC
jgi:hypothetical protein